MPLSLRSLPWVLALTVPLALVHEVGTPERPVKPKPGFGEPGGPGRLMTPDEAELFERGRALFERDFHKSAGLGAPEMNADSCRGCHQDPVVGGAGGLELNVSRFARDHAGAGPFEDLPGGQALSKLRPPARRPRSSAPA